MAGSQPSTGEVIPKPGEWPVDPQEDVPIAEDRIWVDGCFDFTHHGHAGAMLQARQLGNELLVGVHSDDDILKNKGPTVMTLQERIAAVDACRWVTKSVPHAPYVTSLPWISHYGCKYVVHGDDITSDSNGEDCYRFVKAAGRFKVVKRTPGISTTDLVGRMLLCTKTHFIKSLEKRLAGEEGPGDVAERKQTGEEMRQRIKDYATDASGLKPGSEVWYWHASRPAKERRVTRSLDDQPSPDQLSTPQSSNTDSNGQHHHHHHHHQHRHHHERVRQEKGVFTKMVEGVGPKKGQRILYVDGGFDLFSTGHIEFLDVFVKGEIESARKAGWFSEEATQRRIQETGADYEPIYLIAGVHDDEVINHWKGINYPIMNIFERGLCVLQCRFVQAVIFGAPFTPSKAYLKALPYGTPDVVAHGPTSFMPLDFDPYAAAKDMGIFKEVGRHDFQHVNAEEIVQRIMKSRALYEERQRKKGEKAAGEEAVKRREELEREAERRRRQREVEGQFGL